MPGPGRTRRLVVLALALVVVAGLVVADVVTLTKAKPSFDNETRSFQNLLKSTTTTTANSVHPRGTTVTGSTPSTTTANSTTGRVPSTTSVPSATSGPSASP